MRKIMRKLSKENVNGRKDENGVKGNERKRKSVKE